MIYLHVVSCICIFRFRDGVDADEPIFFLRKCRGLCGGEHNSAHNSPVFYLSEHKFIY